MYCSRNSRRLTQMQSFRNVVDDCGLYNLGFSGYKYTWSNRREVDDLVQTRLDRALANLQWKNAYPDHKITHLPFGSSDHSPILIYTDFKRFSSINLNRRQRTFRFEQLWTNHNEYFSFLEREWNKSNQPVTERLDHIGKALRD